MQTPVTPQPLPFQGQPNGYPPQLQTQLQAPPQMPPQQGYPSMMQQNFAMQNPAAQYGAPSFLAAQPQIQQQQMMPAPPQQAMQPMMAQGGPGRQAGPKINIAQLRKLRTSKRSYALQVFQSRMNKRPVEPPSQEVADFWEFDCVCCLTSAQYPRRLQGLNEFEIQTQGTEFEEVPLRSNRVTSLHPPELWPLGTLFECVRCSRWGHTYCYKRYRKPKNAAPPVDDKQNIDTSVETKTGQPLTDKDVYKYQDTEEEMFCYECYQELFGPKDPTQILAATDSAASGDFLYANELDMLLADEPDSEEEEAKKGLKRKRDTDPEETDDDWEEPSSDSEASSSEEEDSDIDEQEEEEEEEESEAEGSAAESGEEEEEEETRRPPKKKQRAEAPPAPVVRPPMPMPPHMHQPPPGFPRPIYPGAHALPQGFPQQPMYQHFPPQQFPPQQQFVMPQQPHFIPQQPQQPFQQ